jgi:hypothetical protein
MLRYGRFRVLLDTVPEGIQVTIHDSDGFVCEVVGREVQGAVLAALAAAECGADESDVTLRRPGNGLTTGGNG